MPDCIFCGATDNKTLYPLADMWGNAYQLRFCNACHAYFLDPLPTAEMLSKAYDDSYYGSGDKKFRAPVEYVLNHFRFHRAGRFARLLKANENVLDIGCGAGDFLLALGKHGKFKLYGTELQGKQSQRLALQKNIHVKTGLIGKEDYPSSSFSLITLFHVFEHIRNPGQMLENIDYLIRSGGHVVFSFPNIVSFQSRLFKGSWLHLDPPRHLFFFAPDDFIRIMQQRGYQLVSESYFSLEQNPFGMIQSLLNLMLKKREVLFEHFKGNNDYTREYSGFNMVLQKVFCAALSPLAVLFEMVSGIFRKGATVELVFRKQ